MTQCILLIHGNAKSTPASDEWEAFFVAANRSGHFEGGSVVGNRTGVGDATSAKPSDDIVGFMRFESESPEPLLELLQKHPVVMHGGWVELCEMPET